MKKWVIKLALIFVIILTLSGISYSCGSKSTSLLPVLEFFGWWCAQQPLANQPNWCPTIYQLIGYRTSLCASCTDGYEMGQCVTYGVVECEIDGSCAPYYFGDWEVASNTGVCGTTVGSEESRNMHCQYAPSCLDKNGKPAYNPRGQFAGSINGLAAQMLSVNPSSNFEVSQNGAIKITFSKSLSTSTISVSGTIGIILPNQVIFTKTTLVNDTIVIPPQPLWNLGANQSLIINAQDVDGNSISKTFNYSVYATGTSPTPDFSTCIPECDNGWGASYAIQFSASGGVPPYTWFVAAGLPPGATMSTSGLFSGPPTMNILGQYPMPVTVVDSAGNSVTNIAKLSTVDLVTACFLLGVCSL